MKSVIVRPPFCRSVDAVFFCVLMNLINGAQNVTYEYHTIIYLIVADVKRSLYDANKCRFPFLSSLLCSAGAAVRPAAAAWKLDLKPTAAAWP